MATREESHEKKIAWKCVQDAKTLLGDGWAHVSDEIRWGLVSANLLGVVVGQHWADDPKATAEQKAAVTDYAVKLWREAYGIRENGWKR